MITRQQIVDGHRRDATVGAVDHDLCASRLRLDTEAASLWGVGKLEVL